MKIPKKAQINKTTYKVKRIHSFKNGKVGEIHYKKKQITLAKHVVSALLTCRVSNREQWETFWHEVLHGILHDMKRHDLNNEAFVRAFCRRLYTVLRSAR